MRSLGNALLILLAGCTSSRGFNKGFLANQIAETRPAITDHDIEDAFSRKPQLTRPFRLGTWFKPPQARRFIFENPEWRWDETDRARFDEVSRGWISSGLVSEIVDVSPLTVSTDKDSLKAIRLAAAQHGLDAILVVAGAADIDRYNNNWAAAYFAILPFFFAPGTVVDAVFLGRAALWDVRNEYLYLSAQSEAQAHQVRPAVFTDEREMVASAKIAALDKLASELSRQLADLGRRTPAPAATAAQK